MRVLNVDSQSSFSNIVVQVIGEMSNKSEPHHKFVQTFVLAEQPNGYFVLNDIFRYLSNDEDEIVEDAQPQAEVPAEEPPTPAEGFTASQQSMEDTAVTEAAVEAIDEKLEEDKQETAPVGGQEVNGALIPPSAEQAADEPETSEAEEEGVEEEEEAAAPAPEEPIASEATQTKTTPDAAAATVAPASADAPPAIKTWASMVGGAAKPPAIPALPVTTPAAQPKAPRPAQSAQAPKATADSSANASTTASTPTSQSNGWQTADHSKKGSRPANKPAPEGLVLAYIKNVNDKVDARILREVLESFGELKYFDVSRPRVRTSILFPAHGLTFSELCLC